MNVLLIDQESMGLDFALRCAAAGHAVKWFRYTKKPIRDGEGFDGFEIVDDWRKHMVWAKDGLIWCSGNFRYLQELDRWRQDFGYSNIFAPTVASARLEIERSVGMDAMKSVGMDIPPYQTFDNLADAEKFARKSDRAWVFKPMGDTDDKALTYVSKDPADLTGWLQRQIKRGAVLKGQCMLQEKIDMLCEFGVSAWFGPEGFLPDKQQICFEHKPLMNGDIGPNTGEQGTVCQYVEQDKLADECLLPMAPILSALGHRGDFAVGVGIDKSGKAWPFEFTARCGWPAFMIQVASHKGDPVKWMRDLCDGKDTLRVTSDVAIGVVCAHPRYPYNASTPEMCEGDPISGLDDVWPDIHPVSMMRGKGPVMDGGKVVDDMTHQTCGEYVLVATGIGKTVEKARKKVYGVIDGISFPGMMYRTDIGEKVIKALPALHKHGYALDMEP